MVLVAPVSHIALYFIPPRLAGLIVPVMDEGLNASAMWTSFCRTRDIPLYDVVKAFGGGCIKLSKLKP